MRINGYEVRYGVTNLDTSYSPDAQITKIPYKDRIISDEQTFDQTFSFELVLANEEIDAVTGMLQMSRIIHLDYSTLNGFFYVTGWEESWIKDMPQNNLRLVTYKVDGYYLGKSRYVNINYFSNYQRTDWPLECPSLVTLVSEDVDRINQTPDYLRFGHTGEVMVFKDPTSRIYFRALPSSLIDTMQLWDGEERLYKDRDYYNSDDDVYLINPLIKAKVNFEDPNSVITFSGFCDDYCSISHPSNDIDYTDIDFTLGVDESNIRIDFTNYRMRYGANFVEILKTPQEVGWVPKRFSISTNPNEEYGYMEPSTTNPCTMFMDRSIGSNSPTQLQYASDPGFIQWNPEDNVSTVSATSIQQIHPCDGFYADTERNYIAFIPTAPIYLDSWDCQYSGPNVRDQNYFWDGQRFNGSPHYTAFSWQTADISAYQSVHFYETGTYNIFCMVRNPSLSTPATFKLLIGGVDQGTVTVPADNTTYIVNLTDMDGLEITEGDNVDVRFTLKSGTVNFHYLVLVPTRLSNRDSPYETVRSIFNDVRQNIEIGE